MTQTNSTAVLENNFGVYTGFGSPNKLSNSTHRLAAEYLSGEVGRTLTKANYKLDDSFLASNPTHNQHYAAAAMCVALNSPLRIMPDELIAGAATVQEALGHIMPLTPFRSISHTTLGFEKALKIGYRGLREQIETELANSEIKADSRDLLEAMLVCLDAAKIWHSRYVSELEKLISDSSGPQKQHYMEVLKNLRSVPENPPANFRQGLQSLWMMWDFQRLCGNWSGIGRIDKMLGKLLKADLESGAITLAEARELIAHFWIKGCEWIGAGCWASGDAQFYQNIVLAGMDEDGNEIANEVTELVFDVVEELHISDFPIAVRINNKTPKRLLDRISAIQRHGGGIIAFYNEQLIIDNLVNFGYPLQEARNFANDGCWEILIPGKTYFGYQPFDLLLLLQETLGLSKTKTADKKTKIECDEGSLKGSIKDDDIDFPTFDALYDNFKQRMAATVDQLKNLSPFSDQPCPLLSIFVDDCISRGRSYLDGGAKYTVRSPHAGGLPDVANSLLVIRRLVYQDKTFTLPQFVRILRDNWAGNEKLRQRILNQFDFFGNDNEEVDSLVRKVYDDYTHFVGLDTQRGGVLRPAGISTFGRNCGDYLNHRTAAAQGQKQQAVLANNFSPAPGTDKRGPTAVIRSHCSVDFSKLPCGTALELKILPDTVRGEDGINALSALTQSFVALGGIFMQIDVVDSELLLDAQANPDKYPNLSVRISGWSARFATLSKQWQDMIINRTQQHV